MMLIDWEKEKLGNVTDIKGGGTPSSKIKEYWDGNIDWYTPTEVNNNGYLNHSIRKISEKGLKNSSANLLPKDTILMSSRAGIGKMAILRTPAATNQGFQSLIPKKYINSYFLYSMQNIISKSANRLASGSTFTEISGKETSKILIKLPLNIKEQAKIGRLFKKIDNLITVNQQKLEKLKLLKRALLQQLFPQNDEINPKIRFANFNNDWKQQKLGTLAKWKLGTGIKKNDLNYSNGKYVIHYADLYKMPEVIGIQDITHHSLSDEGTLVKRESILFPKSDVTPQGLARTSSLIANEVYAGSDVLIGEIKNSMTNYGPFLSFEINRNSNDILSFITGSTIRHINSKSLSKLDINITNYTEQNEIASLLIKLNYLITFKYQNKINKYDALKKALLQNMFI
ncbi:restriction endonuclease subunit S [Fructilactobacillus hinvesii]|uniref:Restriction endonuclease subunit S n=1 Tax=Fructilactobacillus hinvesii TaxID=2940300 RepID=A0ABY5BTC0_9LACO|nr:restriction endonuclease subunit S [Fructilactobacillus hinvesii]USS88347.1 restriction endonuclease subunit S [Fructilactobacillus hinvesii]